MSQHSILMGPARGLMFLNWLKTVFCGPEMCWILKGIWDPGWKAIEGNQHRVPPPLVYTGFYSSCVEVVTLLGGNFSSPSWWNIFGGSCSKERPAPGLPGLLIGHWLLGDSGKCMFWHSCFKFPNAAVPVTAHDEIMSPVNYLQRQGCIGRGALIVKWKLPKAMKQ